LADGFGRADLGQQRFALLLTRPQLRDGRRDRLAVLDGRGEVHLG
jgi:hypothetical protein